MTISAPAKKVKVLTDADLKQNGGSYTLLQQPPVPVAVVSGAVARIGGLTQPIYVVTNPTERIAGPALPVISVGTGPEIAGPALPVYIVSGSF